MITYFIVDNDGLILQYGNVVDKSCLPNGNIYFEEVPDGATHYKNGKFEFNVDLQWQLGIGKQKRLACLSSSDWTQLPDINLTIDKKNSWKEYRQKLRDMTDEMLINDDFPAKPT